MVAVNPRQAWRRKRHWGHTEAAFVMDGLWACGSSFRSFFLCVVKKKDEKQVSVIFPLR